MKKLLIWLRKTWRDASDETEEDRLTEERDRAIANCRAIDAGGEDDYKRIQELDKQLQAVHIARIKRQNQ